MGGVVDDNVVAKQECPHIHLVDSEVFIRGCRVLHVLLVSPDVDAVAHDAVVVSQILRHAVAAA